jgi:signal transduction histidine kinase
MIRQQDERIRLQNYILVGIAGVILLSGLLIHSQYRKNKLRQEARLQSQLRTQQEAAARAVIEAEENERQRIARDLHDGVGQMMSAAKMNLSAFESNFHFENEEQKLTFEKIIQLVDESCREVRTVSHVMMPNALQKNNLGNAIREFADKLNDPGLKIHIYTSGLDERMDSNIETVLYRVIQECVTNAARHAGATSLDISLVKENGEITGTIEDNGKGFDPTGVAATDGMGLKNITSRIEYLKGTVDVDSVPGKGTVIAFHVPA